MLFWPIVHLLNQCIPFTEWTLPQQPEVSCNFDGYLVYKMANSVVEVQLKIKTKWAKYMLEKTFYTRIEKYRPWDRANKCKRIHSRRRRPHQGAKDSVDSSSTDSGTSIPTGYGKGYPPQIFTDPKNLDVQKDSNRNSDQPDIPNIDKYCHTCISKWSRCICTPPSDWDMDFIDITQPDKANDDKTTSKNNKVLQHSN